MDHKNFYSMLLVSFRREDRQGLLILPKTLLHHLCRKRGWEQAEGTRRSETNGHFFPLFSHVFTRHPVAFPSGAARCGLDPPYVPAETSDPKPCHRHRLFLACLETASFFNPGFPFGPYQVWPFAQVLAESLLTGGFPNGISSGSIIGTPALSQALESNQGVELLRWKASLNEAHMLFLMN